MKCPVVIIFAISFLLSACEYRTGSRKQVNSFGSKNFMGDTLFDVFGLIDHPIITLDDPGTEGNIFGFEGGRVLKHDSAYHIFTTEMYCEPAY